LCWKVIYLSAKQFRIEVLHTDAGRGEMQEDRETDTGSDHQHVFVQRWIYFLGERSVLRFSE